MTFGFMVNNQPLNLGWAGGALPSTSRRSLKLSAGDHFKCACGWWGLCSVPLRPPRHDLDPLFKVRTQFCTQSLGPPVGFGHLSMLDLGTKYMFFTKSF